ncbi:MAG TPA: DNA polymerase IV [Candidatus Acidoferrales bacterium]|nr:DNA polymerase IV [Candidatus Acidoferrales bacterium]
MDRDKFPTIFHIDIDAFFASVEESLCPALRGKPVIVGGLPNERGVVACPNYEAREFGVKTAMPLSQAYRIAPAAIFVRGNYKEYEKYSRRFIEILHDFSPVLQAVSLDEAFLDADGCLHFWNYEPRSLAMAIKRAIWEELKITVSIGIASNKLCAKVATDYSKKAERKSNDGIFSPPNGLFIVPLGGEKNFLAPLSVSALPGIGKRTAEALDSLGIKTVRELADTNVSLLRQIFGIVGNYLHAAANGSGDADVSEGNHDAKSISRSTTFSGDSGDEEFITSVIFYLSEKVAKALRRDKLAASTIFAKMRYSDGAPLLGYSLRGGSRIKSPHPNRRFVTYQKNYTLDEPTNSEFEIASAAFALFKSLWLRKVKVRLVGVGVMNIKKECIQLDLFRRSELRRTDLLRSVDRLRDKFGYHSVYFGIIDKMEQEYESDRNGFRLHTTSLSR